MLRVSAGIVVSNSKILCFQKGKSKHNYLTNKYEFPGGKIESGETPEQALIREFNEELQTIIKPADLQYLCKTQHEYPDFSVEIYSFIIKTDCFEFTLTEHKQAIWSTTVELDSLDWAEADKEIVEHVKAVL